MALGKHLKLSPFLGLSVQWNKLVISSENKNINRSYFYKLSHKHEFVLIVQMNKFTMLMGLSCLNKLMDKY